MGYRRKGQMNSVILVVQENNNVILNYCSGYEIIKKELDKNYILEVELILFVNLLNMSSLGVAERILR